MDHSFCPPPLDRRPPAWRLKRYLDLDQPPASSGLRPPPYSPFFPALTPEPPATWQPLFWLDDRNQMSQFVDRSDSSRVGTLLVHAPTRLLGTNAPLSPSSHLAETLLLSDDQSLFGSAPQRIEHEAPPPSKLSHRLPLAPKYSFGEVKVIQRKKGDASQFENIPPSHAAGSTRPQPTREELTNDLENLVSIYFGKM